MGYQREGKAFEKIVENCLKQGSGYLLRLHDSTSGFVHVGNPCDYLYHMNGILYCLECKTVEYSRFGFHNIQDLQMDGLVKANKFTDIWAGFVIYYRSTKVTQLVNIATVCKKLDEGCSSVSALDTGMIVPSTPMRTFSKYIPDQFDKALREAARMKYKGEV